MTRAETVVPQILGIVKSPQGKAALRRGATAGTRHYAIPYLGSLGWNHTPEWLYLFGALVSEYSDGNSSSDTNLGKSIKTMAVKSNTYSSDIKEDRWGKKLAAMQNQKLVVAYPTLRSALRQVVDNKVNINWFDLYYKCQGWDIEPSDGKRSVREQLLEEYYRYNENSTEDKGQ